jgi:NAD(P)-dependent dehydrogenase (short-subunit alcohol dehydrogenase family)
MTTRNLSQTRTSVSSFLSFPSFPSGGIALVIGASGGIGAALVEALRGASRFAAIIGLSRPTLELRDEATIAASAAQVAAQGTPRLILDATGVLHAGALQPEKSWRQLDPIQLAEAFAINAIGPALLMKHYLPLLPIEGKSVFATLSARVGSIGDNRLGGWYGYRASKAALNQFVRTAAVELHRRQRQAICVALHPGTVETQLSSRFGKAGLEVQSPAVAAARLLHVIDGLLPADNGSFFDQHGRSVPW